MKRKQTTSKSAQIAKSIYKQSKVSDSSSSERRFGKFWKPNEDSILIELQNRHNGNWKLIAEGIPGRNLSQCQQRWKRINPNKILKIKKLQDQLMSMVVIGNRLKDLWMVVQVNRQEKGSQIIWILKQISKNSLYKKIKQFQNNIEYMVLSGAKQLKCQIEDQYSEDLSLGKLSEESFLLLYKKSTYVRGKIG
ncbi:unnamed protein product [Paramecium sonneborni]|uniref:Myb-like DNA-binding domain-containing protein n=1 Tax=Paramecium sonneborni TaxID=65129 RepID=A0A8S1LEB9_9CILI|nr:unnamed protein product [Paramecium sonneborni]